MRTPPRKHSDATQITAEILKETGKPRQPASVRDAFEKMNPRPRRPANAARRKSRTGK